MFQVLRYVPMLFLLLISGCNFLSVKQYQCLEKDWQKHRDEFKLPVYKGMRLPELQVLFRSTNSQSSFSLVKSSDNKVYLKYGSCPIRRYVFNNGVLRDEGRLYFDGIWHYE